MGVMKEPVRAGRVLVCVLCDRGMGMPKLSGHPINYFEAKPAFDAAAYCA